jgi:predicted lipoprotein
MKIIEDKPRVSLIVVGVLALAMFSCGPSQPPIPSMKEAYATIDDMARRTQGDYTKLTPAEQSQIDSFAKGHGKTYLAKRYKIITTGGK